MLANPRAVSGTVVDIRTKVLLDNVPVDPELDRGRGIPDEGNNRRCSKERPRLAQDEKSSALGRPLEREREWWSRERARQRSRKRVSRIRGAGEREQLERTRRTRSVSRPPALGTRLIATICAKRTETEALRGLSFHFHGADRRRDRTNGAGKKTLFRMINGKEKPDAGR